MHRQATVMRRFSADVLAAIWSAQLSFDLFIAGNVSEMIPGPRSEAMTPSNSLVSLAPFYDRAIRMQ